MAKNIKQPDSGGHLPQFDRFKEAARQLEADESEAAFDDKLRQILPDKTAALTPEPPNKPTDKR